MSSVSFPRTIVYVDGFNLYYGAVKNTPYRWLDIPALCRRMLPRNDIQHVNYFTTRVKALPHDPGVVLRQAVFLRACRTLPDFTIYYGKFNKTKTRMALVNPRRGGPKTCEVWKTEEKRSDVNIATRLLVDAFNGEFDVAAVMTDDSDLRMPVRVVREMGLGVVILSPHDWRSKDLAPLDITPPSGWYGIRRADLKECLLPTEVADGQGGWLTMPAAWGAP